MNKENAEKEISIDELKSRLAEKENEIKQLELANFNLTMSANKAISALNAVQNVLHLASTPPPKQGQQLPQQLQGEK